MGWIARRVASAIVLALALMIPQTNATTAYGSGEAGLSAYSGSAPVGQVPATEASGAMAADEQAAVFAVDSFWKRHFTELFGLRYRSPRVAGEYLGSSGPACAGHASAPDNAFYCRPEDFLAWDRNLMAVGYRQIGNPWIYLIIAHEWGHAIQARLPQRQTAEPIELQADCLAGATLQGAARDGLVTVEASDADGLARTLAAAADNYPWTNRHDHGDAQQRISAFNTGSLGGVLACFP
ncbi:MAG: neutral zinc metallopeptidase [Pseudonocardia sp.]|nr:neutral zinc metallopeptidase [Pseudonocardia sp.]